MNTELDHRSIAFDLNSSSPTTNSVPIETTDFSKYLRIIAGINTPSVPCAVICIATDLIFTLITLVIGCSNISACPIEPRVPIYLVVAGTINLTSIFLTIVASFLHIKEKDDNIIGFFYVISSAIIIIIFKIFNLIWLILGTVWIFSVFNQVQYTTMNEETYCQKNLYQYALVSVVLEYIIPFLIYFCKNLPSLMKC